MYYIFSNAVGVDHDTIKTGNAMIIDPFGKIMAESRVLGDDVVVGRCIPEKIIASGGRDIFAPGVRSCTRSWLNHCRLGSIRWCIPAGVCTQRILAAYENLPKASGRK